MIAGAANRAGHRRDAISTPAADANASPASTILRNLRLFACSATVYKKKKKKSAAGVARCASRTSNCIHYHCQASHDMLFRAAHAYL